MVTDHDPALPRALVRRLGDLEHVAAFAVGPDDVLVIAGAELHDLGADTIVDIIAELNDVLPGRWLVVGGYAGIKAIADQPDPPPSDPSPRTWTDGSASQVWQMFAPELRTRLKALATRFDPPGVAEAAAALAAIIAEHGPRAEAIIDELDRRASRP